MQRPSLWLYLPTNITRPPVSGFIIRSMSSLGHIAIANIYICTHIYIMCAIYGPVPISVENSCRLYFGGIARTFLFHPSHCLLISIVFSSPDTYPLSKENPWFYCWITAAIFSSCYAYTWDIKMDWGLFDSKAGDNRFLREEIVYSSTVSPVGWSLVFFFSYLE